MKYFLFTLALLSAFSIVSAAQTMVTETIVPEVNIAVAAEEPTYSTPQASQAVTKEAILSKSQRIRVNVVGQGVAPMNTISPAQAYALAKRAAVADAYRIIAEKIKGVRIEGHDLIKDMMIKRSTVRTSVDAMVRNASIIETNFKDGLCEVEMEVVLSYTDFSI
jgi:hypothetical protein